jgi:hypothetical protein
MQKDNSKPDLPIAVAVAYAIEQQTIQNQNQVQGEGTFYQMNHPVFQMETKMSPTSRRKSASPTNFQLPWHR